VASADRMLRPEVTVFRAAHASVQLDLPTLRSLSWGDVELVQSVPATVRDRNWGTVPGAITDLETEVSNGRSRLTFVCTHDNGDIGFTWTGEVGVISLNHRTAVISYSMMGRVTRDFSANRIGFCVLHPLSVAGSPVSLRSPAGISSGAFPRAIAPHQTFLELTGMSYSVGSATVDIRFEGGLFETEDQRNWTDASFKTYSPPLRIPFPRAYKKGEMVRQRMLLQLNGPSANNHRSRGVERVVALHLGGIVPAKLPAIGIGIGGQEKPGTQRDLEDALLQLGPTHLHAVVEPERQDWQTRLRAAIATASAAGAPLQCEVVVTDPGQLEPIAETLTESDGRLSGVLLFDKKSSVTTPAIVSSWRTMAQERGLGPSVFGGSRANFTELNRNEPPYELISGLTFAINPQVHAFGDDEIVETLPVQEAVARQAAAMAPGRPLHVGPVTLKPRFNPVATDKSGLAEAEGDARQSSWWAAGWTLGSLAALARGGATAVTYFNAFGPDGLLYTGASASPSLTPCPAFEVLRRVLAIGRAHLLATRVSDDKALAVLALSRHDRFFVFAANLVNARRAMTLKGRAFDFVCERLQGGDEQPAARSGGVTRRSTRLHLAPYEVVLLTGPF
jgi:D-apionolactonase